MNLPKDQYLQERWDFFFRTLNPAIARPTSKHPASKVWKRSDLVRTISRVRKENIGELRTTFPSAQEVIARMEQIAWLTPVPVESPAEGKPTPKMYLLDMEATPEEMPDSLELLQGFQPDGVLSYFSILAFHELTTQVPNFAHIGILRPPSPKASRASSKGDALPKRGNSSSKRNPLGSLAFSFQGVACYTTRRDRTLVPGVQTREMGPRTRLRMTTLEQTLLDTLLHPIRCGGEAVVFEAWERALDQLNPDRLAKYLEQINREDFERRVGAMMALMDFSIPTGALRRRLEARRERAKRVTSEEAIPLLQGLVYSRSLPDWGVTVP